MHRLEILFAIMTILGGLGAILVYLHDRKSNKEAKKMVGISEVVKSLGGTEALQVKIEKKMELDRLIRDGIPYKAFDHVKEKLKITNHELGSFVGLKITGKMKRGRSRLSLIASDRLYRLARVYAMAELVLGDEDRGREWLKRPQYGLECRVPLEIATTEIGAREVENLLGKIEYSVLT